ncbi:MAG TPA: hypothetical protein VFT95_21040 [Micromonosporaceae bacterium]|nr:hypothetical protein [Micromonosporaceae bacterium]
MIWAATASGRHEAVWYDYPENVQVAGGWAGVATQLGRRVARRP